MHRTLTVIAMLAVLLATAQLYAQNLPITKPATMPDLPIIGVAETPEPTRLPPRPIPPPPPTPPPIRPPSPPFPEPIIRFVELRGYIYAYRVPIVVPPRNLRFITVYYLHTTDGRSYWLVTTPFTGFYLCDSFTNYVGTGRLVIVKGTLLLRSLVLIAT